MSASPRRALLLLEDGRAFPGLSAAADGTAFGEVVFNTAMAGYQETLTDPSYRGQIVAMTASHVGNYGENGEDAESDRIQVSAFCARHFPGGRPAFPLLRALRTRRRLHPRRRVLRHVLHRLRREDPQWRSLSRPPKASPSPAP